MTSSYLNIVSFLLTTLFYYLAIKPNLTYEISVDATKQKEYITNNYMYLTIYLLLVMLIQFIVNASIISSSCGGNITENMGASGFFTFLPWTLIFGVMILILTIYPGFKSVFSDVVGYYWISNSANKIITELLIDQNIQHQINENINSTIEQKEAMQNAADAIIKIFGNNSLLINQIVPSNYNSYWNILIPLMKDKYKQQNNETNNIKKDFFELVVTRDNVGESMWYIYTGILLTSLIQLKITTRGCINNSKTMEENYQKFLKSEKEAKQQQELSTSTTYTITN
jgi:hypothetical protein